MKITYLGHSSFLLTTDAGTRIVTDPFDPSSYPGTLRYRAFHQPADIVTISHDHADHARPEVVRGSPVIFKGSGKFAANEVELIGVATYHDDQQGSKRGRNTVFVISADDLRIAHMGDLGHVLTADQAAEIGAVHVALIPIGGFYTIDAGQAEKVACQIGAKIVIPMHYSNDKCSFPIGGVEEFVRGKPNVTRAGSSSLVVAAGTLPGDQEIVVLDCEL